MPKPHSTIDIQTAVFDLYGNKFGFVSDYNRMYVRKKGKFIPIGYEIEMFKSTFDSVTRKFTRETTIRYLTDDDLGI